MMPADETPAVNAAGDRKAAIPEEMRIVLAENAAILGTCDLRFTMDRQYSVPNLPRPVKEDHEFYLEDGKLRHRFSQYFPASNSVVQVVERAFDGKVFYYGSINGPGQPLLFRLLGDNPDDPKAKYWPVECAIVRPLGIELPTTVSDWINVALTSALLKMTSEAESVSIEEGENSTIKVTLEIPEPVVVYAKSLDLEAFESYRRGYSEPIALQKVVQRMRDLRSMTLFRTVVLWLDPAKGYALMRRVDSTPDGKLIETTECRNLEFSGKGHLWTPRASTIRIFLEAPDELEGFVEEAEETVTITLHHVSLECRKSESFALAYGPGASITDRSTAAAKVSPTGATFYVEPADENALREAAKRARPGRTTIVVINVLVLLVLVIVVFWRKRTAR
jgi:hypothetical protein